MSWFSFDERCAKQVDWWLLAGLLLLTAFGMLIIDGTTYAVQLKRSSADHQLKSWAIGLLLMLFIVFLDYGQLRRLAVPAYLLCLVLLAGLLVLRGTKWVIVVNGAASWYRVAGFTFQPSEFTKIAVVLMVAAYLAQIKTRLPGWLDLVAVALMVVAPCVLIKLQPDLGTIATFLPLIVVAHWAAGGRRRIYVILAVTFLVLAVGYGAVVVARGGEYPLLTPNQARRVRAFTSELLPGLRGESSDAGMAASIQRRERWGPLQSRIALGSGRVWGKGWRQGTQSRLEFLPIADSDYIFASCAEQFGFAGCMLVLVLYALLVSRSMLIALRARDWFGYLLVIGFLTVFATHIVLNIGVATDLLPVTGLPLPLLSNGGSFLLTNYIGFGIILNVAMRRFTF